MKKTVIAASASLMGVFSINSAAMASDSWSGLHGGLSVGYQDGQLLGSNGGSLGYYGFINPDPGSPTIGAFVGYNYQVPQTPFVASLEASLNIGGEERTRAGAKFPASHPEAKVSVPYATAVKARFGYAIDKFLPYVQGGVVGAETRFRVTDDDGFYAGTNKFATGWLAGIGVD